ncbi:MAG TPA: amidase [Burkholderiales bacterium]|nr:amidase [Burkholderiales bacterium]
MPLRSPAAKPASPEDLKGTVQALSDGTLAARAYCESCLARIRATDPRLKAWIALDDERALTIAAARDAERSQGAHTGALHGVPVGVKDLYDTDDLPTEMGSPAFVGNQPGKNAELVGRILAAGGYVLGKTVTTEFAYMHPAETRNPWNPRHTPGGSSSGSAAAVAARHVPVAVGTQTNGSVIRPAAFCGVVGFKPSLDSLPIQGALPFAETLDHVGLFARTVADAAYFAASLAESGTFAPEIEALSRPPKIAVLPRFPWNAAEPGAARHLQASLKRLADAGTELKTVALPEDFDEAHRVHRTIMLYEGAREHATRQASYRRVMSAVLNAAIDEGLAMSHDDYRGALVRRAALAELALDLFEDCDALASLPAPGAAPERIDVTGDPSFCTLWTLLGFPALTLPTGLSDGGMPYGMQLAGPAGGDDRLLRVARWCEAVIGFKDSPR